MVDREIWLDVKALLAFLSIVIPLMFAVSVLVTYLIDLVFS